eukprot:2647997-Prymnesium_polylepis.1
MSHAALYDAPAGTCAAEWLAHEFFLAARARVARARARAAASPPPPPPTRWRTYEAPMRLGLSLLAARAPLAEVAEGDRGRGTWAGVGGWSWGRRAGSAPALRGLPSERGAASTPRRASIEEGRKEPRGGRRPSDGSAARRGEVRVGGDSGASVGGASAGRARRRRDGRARRPGGGGAAKAARARWRVVVWR